jgi:hypothetical protein
MEPPIDAVCEELETEAQQLDELPILAEVRPLEAPPRASLPAIQAAAAAATGFVAGAATLAVAHYLAKNKLGRPKAPQYEFLPVVSSQTFIVDVHRLGRPGE